MEKINKKVYALSRQYTDESILGTAGVLVGRNCQIASKERIIDKEGSRTLITFAWYADGETEARTETIEVWDGKKGDRGEQGVQGSPGYSPEITVLDTPENIYRLHIKTEKDEFNTPNLKGSGGGINVDVDDESLVFLN